MCLWIWPSALLCLISAALVHTRLSSAVPQNWHPDTGGCRGLGLIPSSSCHFAPPFREGTGTLCAAFNVRGLILGDVEIIPKQVLKDIIKRYKNMIMEVIITTACSKCLISAVEVRIK